MFSKPDFCEKYLAINQDSKERWNHFFEEQSANRFGSLPLHLELIPLHDQKIFSKFSDVEKNSLFWGFIQINAEALVLLEQLLVAGMRHGGKFKNLSTKSASEKFAGEELLHSRVFRRFLRTGQHFFWPQGSLILHGFSIRKKIMLYLAKHHTAAILLPGAKSETYSLCYSKFLKKVYCDASKLDWVEINRLHALDEASHVPFDYELFHEEMRSMSFYEKCINILASSVFFVCLQ